jgi:hypothetical protein
MRNVLVELVEKIKVHVLCSIFFPPENRAFYEIMWKNIVKPEGPHVKI